MSLQNEQNEESIPINKNIRHDHTSVNNQGSKQNISNMGVLSYSDASATINKKFQFFLLAFQAIALLCFYFMTPVKDDVGEDYKGGDRGYKPHGEHDGHSNDHTTTLQYASFQDVHVMIFIGFGFLMTFLKDYNWSSVGFTLMISAVVIQWSMIWHAIFFEHYTINLGFQEMFEAEFSCGAILISFGACLGKINHVQLLIMAIFETIFYKLNAYMIFNVMAAWVDPENDKLGIYDIGGSMVIHAFGAYFGLAVAKAMYDDRHSNSEKEGANYTTDLFAMIGTVFLWMYWPSFNSIPATDEYEKQVVMTNTYLSLAAAAVTAFAVSGFSNKDGKLDMVHIQNATLAGGVAMGSSANMEIGPFYALAVGTAAGWLSTAGYQNLQETLLKSINLHDTCGVNNLHGMPGIVGCLFSITFGTMTAATHAYITHVDFSATLQFYGLASTLIISLVGGYVTGLIIKFIPGISTYRAELFEDNQHWLKEHGE